jgi:predicted helicase
MVDWGRFDVMSNMLVGSNLGLRTTRLQKDNPGGFVTNDVITHKVFNSYDSNSIFPLYLYHEDGTRTPNFRSDVLKAFAKNLTKPYEPEEILDYIYAVLYSPRYRKKYKEFLKSEFPRIPNPVNDDQFKELSTLGTQLRDLHLMTSKLLSDYETTYPVSGSNEVEKARYVDKKVWINAKQYFGNVPEVAWNFYIGGYQPARKWLKDRKARKLTSEDIEHYQKIIKVLIETDEIMAEIDKVAQTT